MKKRATFIILALGLLVLFAAAAPALAEPATKVPASSALVSTTYTSMVVEDTPSGVRHIHATYTNKRTLTLDGTPYDVYVVGSMDATGNPITGVLLIHFSAVWYVGSLTAPTPNGFSGNMEQRSYRDPVTLVWLGAESHLVFQGFGSFAQDTLKLDYEGPYAGATNPSGYCIIP